MAVDLGKDLVIVATLVVAGITLILAFYVRATFAYSISERSLTLRWRILGKVPFASRRIELTDIQEARTFRRESDLLGGFIFGNIPRKRVVTVLLRRRFLRFFLMKRVFITPDEPESFLTELHQRIADVEVDGRTRGAG
jgi:hypothetical protein